MRYQACWFQPRSGRVAGCFPVCVVVVSWSSSLWYVTMRGGAARSFGVCTVSMGEVWEGFVLTRCSPAAWRPRQDEERPRGLLGGMMRQLQHPGLASEQRACMAACVGGGRYPSDHPHPSALEMTMLLEVSKDQLKFVSKYACFGSRVLEHTPAINGIE